MFDDSSNVGVKAANIATMRTFEFPPGTIPNGFAVPFYYYDEFMKHNGLYDVVDAVRSDPQFQTDEKIRDRELKHLRELIKKAQLPDWMMGALAEVQESFPGTYLHPMPFQHEQ